MADFTFTFTKLENINPDYPCEGQIKVGPLVIQVYPSEVTINCDDIPKILKCLADLRNGNTNSFIFSNVDGLNKVAIQDDTFIINWGKAYDVIACSELKCSYSANKTEINKFLTYLYDEYNTIYSKGDYMETISMAEIQNIVAANRR